MAAPVRSYCFTVETELIGPAMLNGAPPKHDDMQAVAFVPEMSISMPKWGASSRTNSHRVSDLDLFVTGEDSANRQFLNLVKQLEDNLRKSGYGIIKKIQRRWRYNEVGDRALYVVDFTINGIHPKLQVIQTDLCDIQEVIDQFDIDIVSVVYDVVNDDFQLSGEVKEAITNRVASIRPFLFHSYDVSKSDLDKFENSMKRMIKYAERGFNFTMLPQIICSCSVSPKVKAIPGMSYRQSK
jgi:uncharacterized protein YfkK (UPF0435 family)